MEAFVYEVPETLSEAQHRAALRAAATYLQGQVSFLPGRLALLFSIGMTGFRVITRLRYGRGYCNLAPDTRRRWTALWAFGKLSLARQLFRAPRSLALMGYYESCPRSGPLSGGPQVGGDLHLTTRASALAVVPP